MEKDKKIAIDIAIIPNQKVIERCIYVNSQLDNSNYISFEDGYYPHITLGMGCVMVDDMSDIYNQVESVIKVISKSKINIIGYEGSKYFSFEIEKDSFINDLHKNIMQIIIKYSHYGKTEKNDFYEADKVRADSGLIKWVNDFETEHSYNKYDPHISLGEGERVPIDFPFEFIPDKIAIFNLGVHGSCKEKIKEFNF